MTPRPLFTPGKDPVPIVQKAGWVPRPVWTIAEDLAFTEIPSRTVQPVASLYTDYATRPASLLSKTLKIQETFYSMWDTRSVRHMGCHLCLIHYSYCRSYAALALDIVESYLFKKNVMHVLARTSAAHCKQTGRLALYLGDDRFESSLTHRLT